MPSKSGRGTRERLTPKQARFVDEYLIDLNASQAALRSGYSANSAEDIGRQLLRKTPVARAIAERKRARSEQSELRAADVLKELASLSYSDVRHYTVDADGRLTLAEGAPDYAMRAVSSIKYKTRTIPRGQGKAPTIERDCEFRLWDKNAALTNLAKHFALLVERHEINLTQQQFVAVRTMSDMELLALLQALEAKNTEAALKLLRGGRGG